MVRGQLRILKKLDEAIKNASDRTKQKTSFRNGGSII
jgi:hypothetical protein